MEKLLKFYDTMQLRPVTVNSRKEALFQVKDGYGPAANSLLVRITASHAGRLTGNHALYLPAMMKVGITSFTNPYQKPVLLNHDEDSDPLGRIKSAEYIDTSKDIMVKDKQIRDFFHPEVAFDDMLKLVDKIGNRLLDPMYAGLGFAQVIAKITDPDAIPKILDGRYLTVSTSMVTDKAVCSICKTDWLKDGKCDHTPGKMYDKKPCFIITGSMRYDELSYVNRPADALAQNVEILTDNLVQDSIPVEQFSLQDVAQDIWIAGKNLLVNAGDIKNTNFYSLQDSLQEVSTLMTINKAEPKADVQIQQVFDSLLPKIEDASLDISSFADQEMVVRIHNHLHDYFDWDVDANGSAPKMPKDKQKLHAKLHQTATDTGFVDAFVLGRLDMTLEAYGVEAPEGTAAKQDDKQDPTDSLIKDQVVTEVGTVENPEAGATGEVNEDSLPLIDEILDEAKCYAAMETILDELATETGESIFTDAKLSTEKRNSLKASTFCGPNKSFPVNDCAHYTAALRLLSRYKGSGSKDAIRKCIERKGKAMKCGTAQKDAEATPAALPTWEELETQRQNLVAQLQELDAQLKDRFEVTFPCPECAQAQDRIKSLEDSATVDLVQLDALQMDAAALEEENLLLRTQLKDAAIATIIDTQQLIAKQPLSMEDQAKIKDKLQDRVLESLYDSIKDLRAQLVTQDGTGMSQTPTEGQVSDPTVKDEEAVVNKDAATDSLRAAVMKNFLVITSQQGKQAAQAYLADMEKRFPEIKVEDPKSTKSKRN